MDYKEKLRLAKEALESGSYDKDTIEYIFPELRESKDEKIRKELIKHLKDGAEGYMPAGDSEDYARWLAWVEKQDEKKSIVNVPPREVILSIWDLGNEWKELTNGCISTEYGTQLDYIQKHWQESTYYLTVKQGEQKPQRMISAEAKEALYDKPTDEEMKELLRTEYEKGRADTIAEMKSSWSEEDEHLSYWTIHNLTELKNRFGDNYGDSGKCIDWIKQLKQRIGG